MTSSPLRPLVFTLLVSFLALTSACGGSVSISIGEDIEASGDPMTTAFDLDDFDAIDVQNSFDVTVTVGDEFFVEAVTNENLIDKLDIYVRDGELKVGLKNGTSVRNATLEATIRLPELVAVEASGASSIDVVGAFGPDQRYSASGASELVAAGSGASVRVEASGASTIDLQLNDVNDVDLDLSGASSLELLSAQRASGDMSGASDLVLPDDAALDVDLSGASEITGR